MAVLTTNPDLCVFEDTLGIGSYGKVCKAKCGQLPCAAKLLHDTLFQHGDSGADELSRRFERECRLLSDIKHPNIIQYFGTERDARTRRLILLIELMDENLTRFLERSPSDLQYHTQLNICYDVALALAYLHSNGIIHRYQHITYILRLCETCNINHLIWAATHYKSQNPPIPPKHAGTCM